MSNLADSAEAAANGQAVILRGRAALLPEDAAVDDDLDVPVEARGYWQGVWLRLQRDKLALAGGVFIVLLFVTAFAGAPLASHFLGHGPNELLSLLLGSIAGAAAGFYRGWADTTISRLVDLTMAFPYLLFVITLAGTLGTRLNHVTFGFLGEGVVTLVLVFGLLGWFYSARVMRSVALSIREKEFIEAARMVGASNRRIIRSHVFPHLVGPLIVLATLNVAAFILAEAGLSFLGLGIQLPTASWGNLLADAPQYYTSRPLLMVWPGVALLLTTLAFNLLGDGLRDAFDPRGSR